MKSRIVEKYLNGHWCKDEQIGKIESKSRDQETKLVSFTSGRSFPRMKITKGSHSDSNANTNH
jgi:hypothetical protein